MNGILQQQILGNTLLNYIFALGFFVAALVVLAIVKKILLSRLHQFIETKDKHVSGVFLGLTDKIVPILYVAAFYLAVQRLVIEPQTSKVISAFCIAVATIQFIRIFLTASLFFLQGFLMKMYPDGGNFIAKSLGTLLRIAVWSWGVVFILSNMGFNVSAVVAGLGIGGVAVALASQHIFSDLFNYFVIFLDRPFAEDDFIVVGDVMGNIEHIGIKSTRIRALSGEQIIIANSDLSSNRIRNFKRMDKRRIVFKFGVTYETPVELLRKIPDMVKSIIVKNKKAAVDRVHFLSFGAYSLDYEVVYFVLSADYNIYMDIQQAINLEMIEIFAKNGIEFAYPTQVEYFKHLNGAAAETSPKITSS